MIGSIEWIEEYVNWLTDTAVVYLNIDVAVSGPRPDFSATPEINTIAEEIMKKVVHPNFGGFNTSLYDFWFDGTGGEIGVLGSGSDFTGFVHKGISSVSHFSCVSLLVLLNKEKIVNKVGQIDMGSNNGPGDPVWHYHSNYDTYHWMATFGDPGFHMHSTMGQFLTLLAYHMIDDTIIPFDIPTYASALHEYYEELLDTISATNSTLDTAPILTAIQSFNQSAIQVSALDASARLSKDPNTIKLVNHKYKNFQRGFVSQGGLPDREFYRHVVNAPGLDTGYAPVTFPGVTEALEEGKIETAREWVGRTARGIERAAEILKV